MKGVSGMTPVEEQHGNRETAPERCPRTRPINRGGRPPKLTVDVAIKLAASLARGDRVEEAARYAGIGSTTLFTWLQSGRAGDPRYAALAAEVRKPYRCRSTTASRRRRDVPFLWAPEPEVPELADDLAEGAPAPELPGLGHATDDVALARVHAEAPETAWLDGPDFREAE
jgi:hypothetical protein